VITCAEKGEITVKGIARPIQTYQVLDLKENMQNRETTISARHDGFAVDIDMHKTSRRQVMSYLQGMLDDLGK
jgi:adenylate cyclase